MEIEALRAFIEVERSGGVTRAAEVLYRSQPAVSRRIAHLERELGVPVFERVASGMVLTDAGRVLLPFAERVLATLRDAEVAVEEVRTAARGQVVVAIVGTLAGSSLTPVLRAFAEAHPGVELRLRTATSHEVSELVRRAEATMGLRYAATPQPGLEFRTLYRERMVVVAAPGVPPLESAVARLADLASARWIAFPEIPGRTEVSARLVGQALDAAGVDESAVLRIDSLTAQKRLIEAGFGIGLLPVSSIEEERASGTLRVIEVADLDLALPVVLVTRTDGYLGATARTLLDALGVLAEELG